MSSGIAMTASGLKKALLLYPLRTADYLFVRTLKIAAFSKEYKCGACRLTHSLTKTNQNYERKNLRKGIAVFIQTDKL